MKFEWTKWKFPYATPKKGTREANTWHKDDPFLTCLSEENGVEVPLLECVCHLRY